jgi:hypothetical protein
MNHQTTLVFPDDIDISKHAQDIIRRFLSESSNRFGRNGVDEIRAHPFFHNSDWTFDNIREG